MFFEKSGILALFLLLSFSVNGQIEISGKITDSLGYPVSSVSVTLRGIRNNEIIGFTITGPNGKYLLKNNHAFYADSFQINISCIGYAVKNERLNSDKMNIDFILKASPILLPGVTVQNNRPMLKQNGDTLNYDVASFTGKQDRTIGEVLKKMPGIEIDNKGKISYNGKPISNFYIDGDDLLDDKYNIASGSIAADMVDKVQVLENHQPIKVLQGATVSDNVALNLSLKNKARIKIMGRAEAGAGSANQYISDETVNILSFKDRYKAINSVKYNNSGSDPSDELISHNFSERLKRAEDEVPAPVLNTGSAGTAEIDKKRYLFNNAFQMNTNNLFKTKKDIQIKTNLSYLHDRQNRDYYYNSTYFFPADTISYMEEQHEQLTINDLNAQVTVNANKEKYYFNNRFKITRSSHPVNSDLLTQSLQIQQMLLQKEQTVSNELSLLKTIHKNDILEVYSYFSNQSNPEQLVIMPGINPGIFNNNQPFLNLMQTVNVPTFFLNNYISLRKTKQNFLQFYKAGFSGQWQEINSNLSLEQKDHSINIVSDSFVNRLQRRNYRIYAEAEYDWFIKHLQLSLVLNTQYRNLAYSENVATGAITKYSIINNPQLKIKYTTSAASFFTGGYGYNNQQGSIEESHTGYILTNYRSIERSALLFPESATHTLSFGYNYKKPIRIFFLNLQALYGFADNNSISGNTIFSSLQKRTNLPFDNTIEQFMFTAGASKYSFLLHSTVSFRASYQKIKWNQLQNNLLLLYNNYIKSLTLSVNSKISGRMQVVYNLDYTNSESISLNTSDNGQKSAVQKIGQKAEASFLPTDNFSIKFKAEHYLLYQNELTGTKQYFFSDLFCQWKNNKLRADFSLGIDNLADTRSFINVTKSANNISQGVYHIRPRMLIVRCAFNF